MEGWNSALGGTLILVSAILPNTLYQLSAYKAPQNVLNCTKNIRKYSVGKWNQENRGYNLALLSKWLHLFSTMNKSTWRSLIADIGTIRSGVSWMACPDMLRYQQFGWVIVAFPYFVPTLAQIGNSSVNSFWQDRWVDDNCLGNAVPDIMPLSYNHNCSCRDCVLDSQGRLC